MESLTATLLHLANSGFPGYVERGAAHDAKASRIERKMDKEIAVGDFYQVGSKVISGEDYGFQIEEEEEEEEEEDLFIQISTM
ncbi:hypothetical protein ACFSVK_22625 [Azorhizophilus paspali]|uniref:hypothetical protein n=1 Tax=Azorhizophilus paspali TaxID=69963 RepID=UPI003641D6DE